MRPNADPSFRPGKIGRKLKEQLGNGPLGKLAVDYQVPAKAVAQPFYDCQPQAIAAAVLAADVRVGDGREGQQAAMPAPVSETVRCPLQIWTVIRPSVVW